MKQVEELYHDTVIKNFRFSGNGEPLLNKRVPDMVRYINERELSERIEITTNASMLTHEMSDALVDAGLTRLLISIQGVTSEKYKRICGFDINFDNFLESLQYFFKNRKSCKVHIKTLDVALDKDAGEYEQFVEMFSPLCDTIDIENVMDGTEDINFDQFAPKGWDSKNRYGGRANERQVCDTLFYLMHILPNGEVNCCGCKQPPHVVGNCFEKSLTEIWYHGKHLQSMRTHLRGKRKLIHDCAICGSITQYSIDNIDPYMKDILKRL